MLLTRLSDGKCAVVFADAGENVKTECLSESEFAYYSGCQSEERRKEFLVSRYAAKFALDVLSGADKYSDVLILKDKNGRPYFPAPYDERSLSVTHSRGTIAVLVFPGNMEYGIDLEFIDRARLPILKKFFPGNKTRNTLDMTILWSVTEAAYKAGIKTDFPSRTWKENLKPCCLDGVSLDDMHLIADAVREYLHSYCCLRAFAFPPEGKALVFESENWVFTIVIK